MDLLSLTMTAAGYRLDPLRAGSAPDEQRQDLRLYDARGQLLVRLCVVWPHGAQTAPLVLDTLPRSGGATD